MFGVGYIFTRARVRKRMNHSSSLLSVFLFVVYNSSKFANGGLASLNTTTSPLEHQNPLDLQLLASHLYDSRAQHLSTRIIGRLNIVAIDKATLYGSNSGGIAGFGLVAHFSERVERVVVLYMKLLSIIFPSCQLGSL